MAPKAPCDEKLKPKSEKHRTVQFKPIRHFAGAIKRPCTHGNNRKPRSKSFTEIKPPENYENMLLFYLTKLKNLFSNPHPAKAARENGAMLMNKLHHQDDVTKIPQRACSLDHPYKYTSSSPPKPREDDVQSKVFRVVSAALQYGFANNVLEKKGDYFCFKHRRSPRLAARQQTPGPRYCQRCCNGHPHQKRNENCPPRLSDRNKLTTLYPEQRPIHTEHGRADRNYQERPNSMFFNRHGRFGQRPAPQNLNRVDERPVDGMRLRSGLCHHCPECRTLRK